MSSINRLFGDVDPVDFMNTQLNKGVSAQDRQNYLDADRLAVYSSNPNAIKKYGVAYTTPAGVQRAWIPDNANIARNVPSRSLANKTPKGWTVVTDNLGKILPKNEAYKYYPGLAEVPVHYETDPNSRFKASYNPEEKIITVYLAHAKNDDDIINSILHESQHYTQEIDKQKYNDKISTGSNLYKTQSDFSSMLMNRYDNIDRNNLNNMLGKNRLSDRLLHDRYMANQGETEARANEYIGQGISEDDFRALILGGSDRDEKAKMLNERLDSSKTISEAVRGFYEDLTKKYGTKYSPPKWTEKTMFDTLFGN